MTERETILAGLRPMFEKARREGLWFYCNYQGLWFSPDELEAEQKRGSFVWGAVNWQLRDPMVQIDEQERAVAGALAQLQVLRQRLGVRTEVKAKGVPHG
jgi:hypothetical protein